MTQCSLYNRLGGPEDWVWMGTENLSPTAVQTLGSPTHSKSLTQPSCCGTGTGLYRRLGLQDVEVPKISRQSDVAVLHKNKENYIFYCHYPKKHHYNEIMVMFCLKYAINLFTIIIRTSSFKGLNVFFHHSATSQASKQKIQGTQHFCFTSK